MEDDKSTQENVEETPTQETDTTPEAVSTETVDETTDTATSEEQTDGADKGQGEEPAPEKAEGQPLSKRAEKRFNNLTKKLGDRAQENAILRSQLAQKVAPPQQEEDLPFKEGEELTLEQIKEWGQQQRQTGESSLLSRIERMEQEAAAKEFLSNWQADQEYMRNKYPELNEDTDDYDDELAEIVVEEVQDELYNKVNPNVRGRVDRIMRAAKIKAREAAVNAAKSQPRQATVSSEGVKAKTGTIKVDSDWIKNEYDPKNPEHVKLVDEYAANQTYR